MAHWRLMGELAMRHIMALFLLCGFIVAQESNEHRARDRQEGDDGEDRPARHQWIPLANNMNQVTKAATPISMAKA